MAGKTVIIFILCFTFSIMSRPLEDNENEFDYGESRGIVFPRLDMARDEEIVMDDEDSGGIVFPRLDSGGLIFPGLDMPRDEEIVKDGGDSGGLVFPRLDMDMAPDEDIFMDDGDSGGLVVSSLDMPPRDEEIVKGGGDNESLKEIVECGGDSGDISADEDTLSWKMFLIIVVAILIYCCYSCGDDCIYICKICYNEKIKRKSSKKNDAYYTV